MPLLAAFAIGLVFGTGILVSGMSNPAKIINFFDVAGAWDPSLAFVMAGGLLVNTIGYALVLLRRKPLLLDRFELPSTTPVTPHLVGGATVFGIGWGLTGFCPGGVVPVLAIGRSEPIIFLFGMIAALIAIRYVRAPSAPAPESRQK